MNERDYVSREESCNRDADHLSSFASGVDSQRWFEERGSLPGNPFAAKTTFTDSASANAKLLKDAMLEREQWIYGRSNDKLEELVRQKVSSLSTKEIVALNTAYAALNNGVDFEEALRTSSVSQASKNALNIYLKGSENRTDADQQALVDNALSGRDIVLFEEAFRGASKSARDNFIANDGEARMKNAFGGMLAGDTTELKQAREFASEGHLSKHRLINDATGILTNSDGSIANAIDSMTRNERIMYRVGKEIFSGASSSELSAEEQSKAVQYYKDMRKSIEDTVTFRDSTTELRRQEDRILNGGPTLVTALADQRGAFGRHDVNKVIQTIDNMDESDWNRLKTEPSYRSQIRETLAHFLDEHELSMAMSSLEDKASSSSFRDSQSPLIARLSAFSAESSPDKAQVLRLVEGALRSNNSLKQQIECPKSSLDESIRGTLSNQLNSIFKTEEERAKYVQPLLNNGRIRIEDRIALSRGTLAKFDDKRAILRDLTECSEDEKSRLLASASNLGLQEKVFGSLNDEQKILAKTILKQGSMDAEDAMRAYMLDMGVTKDELKKILSQCDEVALDAAKAQYKNKYGTSTDEKSVEEQIVEKMGLEGRSLMRTSPLTLNEALQEYSERTSGVGRYCASDAQSRGAINNFVEAQTLASVKDKSLTADQCKALNQPLFSSLDAFKEDKGAAADRISDTVLGGGALIGSLAGAIPSGGLSLGMLGAVACTGAGMKVGTRYLVQGADYEFSKWHLAEGALAGTLSVVGPSELGKVLKLAAPTSIAQRTLLSVGSGSIGAGASGTLDGIAHWDSNKSTSENMSELGQRASLSALYGAGGALLFHSGFEAIGYARGKNIFAGQCVGDNNVPTSQKKPLLMLPPAEERKLLPMLPPEKKPLQILPTKGVSTRLEPGQTLHTGKGSYTYPKELAGKKIHFGHENPADLLKPKLVIASPPSSEPIAKAPLQIQATRGASTRLEPGQTLHTGDRVVSYPSELAGKKIHFGHENPQDLLPKKSVTPETAAALRINPSSNSSTRLEPGQTLHTGKVSFEYPAELVGKKIHFGHENPSDLLPKKSAPKEMPNEPVRIRSLGGTSSHLEPGQTLHTGKGSFEFPEKPSGRKIYFGHENPKDLLPKQSINSVGTEPVPRTVQKDAVKIAPAAGNQKLEAAPQAPAPVARKKIHFGHETPSSLTKKPENPTVRPAQPPTAPEKAIEPVKPDAGHAPRIEPVKAAQKNSAEIGQTRPHPEKMSPVEPVKPEAVKIEPLKVEPVKTKHSMEATSRPRGIDKIPPEVREAWAEDVGKGRPIDQVLKEWKDTSEHPMLAQHDIDAYIAEISKAGIKQKAVQVLGAGANQIAVQLEDGTVLKVGQGHWPDKSDNNPWGRRRIGDDGARFDARIVEGPYGDNFKIYIQEPVQPLGSHDSGRVRKLVKAVNKSGGYEITDFGLRDLQDRQQFGFAYNPKSGRWDKLVLFDYDAAEKMP